MLICIFSDLCFSLFLFCCFDSNRPQKGRYSFVHCSAGKTKRNCFTFYSASSSSSMAFLYVCSSQLAYTGRTFIFHSITNKFLVIIMCVERACAVVKLKENCFTYFCALFYVWYKKKLYCTRQNTYFRYEWKMAVEKVWKSTNKNTAPVCDDNDAVLLYREKGRFFMQKKSSQCNQFPHTNRINVSTAIQICFGFAILFLHIYSNPSVSFF